MAAVVTLSLLPYQDRAKGTHVKVIGAHPAPRLIHLAVIALLCPDGFIGALLVVRKKATVLHKYLVSRFLAPRGVHVIAHLALQADVGHQAVHRLRIDTRKVAGVRVAIGVAVRDIEKQHEIVAALHIHVDRVTHQISLPAGQRCLVLVRRAPSSSYERSHRPDPQLAGESSRD